MSRLEIQTGKVFFRVVVVVLIKKQKNPQKTRKISKIKENTEKNTKKHKNSERTGKIKRIRESRKSKTMGRDQERG